jgi:hypothetical protein
MNKAFLGLVLGFVLATPAWALHIFTPPWIANPTDPHWTGKSATTESWEFWGNPLGTTDPAHANNPFGQPGFTPIGASPQFVSNGPGLTGVNTWHVDVDGGGFTLAVPNDPRQRDFKAIHLQYTSDKSSTGAPTTQPGGSSQAGGVADNGPSSDGDQWYTYEWMLVIKPNPPFETITVRFPASANIGEIDVSTVCVPEPATITLLGTGVLGFLALAWRSRRKA